MERVQYNAWLVITGALKGISREHLYQELGLESLKDRVWDRKLCFFYKIVNIFNIVSSTPQQSNLPSQILSKE